VDRDDMGDDAHGLDILLFAKTGGDDTAKPALAETAGVVPYSVHDFDHAFRQRAETVVLAFDRGGRQRVLAPAAQRTGRDVARFGRDGDALAPVPPSPGAPDPLPGASVRGRQIAADLHRRGGVELAHRAFLLLGLGS